MLDITLSNEEKVRITANPRTPGGRPAQIDGELRATLLSGEGSVERDPSNQLSLHLLSGDTPGDATFLIEADADLGSGVVLVQDTVTLHVQGAQAVALGLVAGAPEPK